MGIITLIVVKDTMRAMCDYSRDVGFVLPWRHRACERGASARQPGPRLRVALGSFGFLCASSFRRKALAVVLVLHQAPSRSCCRAL